MNPENEKNDSFIVQTLTKKRIDLYLLLIMKIFCNTVKCQGRHGLYNYI